MAGGFSQIGDIGNNTLSPTAPLLYPQAVTTGTTNSSAIDCINAALSPINVFMLVGTFTSPGTLAVQMQEASDDPANPGSPLSSSWTNIATQTNFPSAFPTISTSNSESYLPIQQMTKRYIRAQLVVTGGGASVLVSMDIFAQTKITGVGTGTSTSPQT